MDTGILVKEARHGNRDALVELVMSRENEYYRLAYTYMGNREDSMDAMEDMIVILHESISKLKKEEAFYSWSKTILANCCKKILKAQKKVIPMEFIREEKSEDGFEQKDSELLVERHLGLLGDSYREVLKLRFYLDLDYQAISDILKIPLGTVKSRISIGLKKLKESMGGEYR